MINKLNNKNNDTANKIFAVFQKSYAIEAKLIGAHNFPPLTRNTEDIKKSETTFYGYSENECLVAVIEVDTNNECLDICSLTVDPSYFKKGIASKLINYVLAIGDLSHARVETAVANTPAISLYKKHGFVEFKRWTPSHGIEKLAMSVVI
ncbi:MULTISPECIES: GNAT family N-acetyltransferase [unclassified Pseudoalteromonas]|uniref:GNAT family N-acetyltransferase n=1 Tax=unclassified Pseudoalteromonas TaxID=194690 RepID=UPI0013FDBF9D|nr:MULTISPECIES: GNAT family N-acetyltransferase [unclassified Pseudoalteromonas]MBH0051907.1 GNAT family N-acetyltransferase [Pseudoalteromonas sp. SWYJZ19]MBH0076848.1 GNAT family N-acetyltransferase [Pseudoalteromonas sp. SWYJ118]